MAKHAAIIGLRVGDEGKGVRVVKLAQIMAEGSKSEVLCYRWHGAANAGHTVVKDGATYKLHQVPAGMVIEDTYNLQGAGVYLNPRKEVSEIEELRAQGLEITPSRLGIASNCAVVFDFHTGADLKNLKRKEHTSTGNGVKQVASDLYGRTAVRFAEFLDSKECARVLRDKFPNGLAPRWGEDGQAIESQSIDDLVASYEKEREFLAPFMVLEAEVRRKFKESYKLGEGAHGFDLDVIEGLYPGVTSSHPSQVPHRPDLILGAIKLYDSSVGHDRPFVGRLDDLELESRLRNLWGERGTTTGKDRYIGWTDIVAAKHAIDVTGVDLLIGNCGDRLTALHDMNQQVGLVTAYKIGEKVYPEWDASFHKRNTLMNAKPVIEWFDPWPSFKDKDSNELHPNAQIYLDRIEELTGKQFAWIGTGPGIDDVIEVVDVVRNLD